MGDCPKQFMEFNDTEDEMREEYDHGTREMIQAPGNKILSPHDKQFEVVKKDQDDIFPRSEYKYPKGYSKIKVPLEKLYKTFEQFAKDCHGMSGRDPKKGRFGYWENPNRQWDWYVLGGRWRGFFKVKQGSRALVGAPGVPEAMTGVREMPEAVADQAYKRDIDFEAMRNDAADGAGAHYDKVVEAFGGAIPMPKWSWKELLKIREAEGVRIDEIRKEYHNQDALKKLEKAKKKDTEHKIFGFFFSLEDYRDGREAFMGRAIRDAFCTHAVLKDGVWYERGSMGGWGMVADEKEGDEWASQTMKLLESVDDDTLLSVYDCHI
jgi:hypothetical protein